VCCLSLYFTFRNENKLGLGLKSCSTEYSVGYYRSTEYLTEYSVELGIFFLKKFPHCLQRSGQWLLFRWIFRRISVGIPMEWSEFVGDIDRIRVRRNPRHLGLLFSSFHRHVRRPVRSLFRSAFSVGKNRIFSSDLLTTNLWTSLLNLFAELILNWSYLNLSPVLFYLFCLNLFWIELILNWTYSEFICWIYSKDLFIECILNLLRTNSWTYLLKDLSSLSYFDWTYSELKLSELILNLFVELRACSFCLVLSKLILNWTYLNLFWTLFAELILNYSKLNLSELILKLFTEFIILNFLN